MDKLEEFIRNNRRELDKMRPPQSIWQNIRMGLHGRRIIRMRWLQAAALIIVIITTGVLLNLRRKGHNDQEISMKSELRNMRSSPLLLETEHYYNNQIQELYTEAVPLLSGYPDIEKELNYDLSVIDSLCLDIKKDLKDNISNQEVIEALINNYRIKLRILEDMLEILRQDKINVTNTEGHEL